MNIAVIYKSMTGHSKKIAEAIAAEIGAQAYNIKSNPKLGSVDVLFVVGGIYSGKSLPELPAFLDGLSSENIKKAVLITSSATGKKGQTEVRRILESKNILVAAEEYHCRGNFLFIKMGHPNKKEIAEAVEFAKNQIS